jgi:hypothetical protein
MVGTTRVLVMDKTTLMLPPQQQRRSRNRPG